MAMRARKQEAAAFAPLTIFDFLPVFTYRGRSGGRRLWINWPVLAALALGYALGGRFGFPGV